MAYLDQMNVKADEQDTVGTDYDIRDKNLNAATAKTSVASTDGVVLKGTDGSYHTIDRSSFTEAVRSVIGGILNNMASKGTAVKGVGVIDNANDFGLTTPSDLASVLGVPRKDFRTTDDSWRTDILTWIQSLEVDKFVWGYMSSGWTGMILGMKHSNLYGEFIVMSYNGSYMVRISQGTVLTSPLN